MKQNISEANYKLAIGFISKYGYVSKNVTEIFRRLNRARDLQFSIKCSSFLPFDHFYIYIFKILSEDRVSIIVVITSIAHWIENPLRRTSERFV